MRTMATLQCWWIVQNIRKKLFRNWKTPRPTNYVPHIWWSVFSGRVMSFSRICSIKKRHRWKLEIFSDKSFKCGSKILCQTKNTQGWGPAQTCGVVYQFNHNLLSQFLSHILKNLVVQNLMYGRLIFVPMGETGILENIVVPGTDILCFRSMQSLCLPICQSLLPPTSYEKDGQNCSGYGQE